MSIRFAELPASRKHEGAWKEEAEALRANPGQWAHFEDYDDRKTADKGGFANTIKRGKVAAFRPDGAFEARVIGGQVWARFVGDAE